jgi:hypothetical protein
MPLSFNETIPLVRQNKSTHESNNIPVIDINVGPLAFCTKCACPMCYECSVAKVIQPLTSTTLSSVQDLHAVVDWGGCAFSRGIARKVGEEQLPWTFRKG